MQKLHRNDRVRHLVGIMLFISTSAFCGELQEKAMNAYDQIAFDHARQLTQCRTDDCKLKVNREFGQKRLYASEALMAAGIGKYPGPSSDRLKAYVEGKPDSGRSQASDQEQPHGQDSSRTANSPKALVTKDRNAPKNAENEGCKPERKEIPGYSSDKRPSYYLDCKEHIANVCYPKECGEYRPGVPAAEAERWNHCIQEKCEKPAELCRKRVDEQIAEYDESRKAQHPMNCCIVGAKQVCARAD